MIARNDYYKKPEGGVKTGMTNLVLQKIFENKHSGLCPLCGEELLPDDKQGFYYCQKGHDETISQAALLSCRLQIFDATFWYWGSKDVYLKLKSSQNTKKNIIFICLAKVK